jgi:antitoxin component YwqK of YwqJK toxin-antitoxin module
LESYIHTIKTVKKRPFQNERRLLKILGCDIVNDTYREKTIKNDTEYSQDVLIDLEKFSVKKFKNGRIRSVFDLPKKGTQLSWDEDGVLRGFLKVLSPNTKRHTTYYYNGRKESESLFVSDQLQNLSTQWYKNGQKEREWFYDKGILNGICVSWWKNGRRESESNILNGLGNGISRDYHKNGVIQKEVNIVSGGKVGLQTTWFNNEQKESEVYFEKGVKDGYFQYWYDTGEIRQTGKYFMGKRDGDFTEYDKLGNKTFVTEYKMDDFVKKYERDENYQWVTKYR